MEPDEVSEVDLSEPYAQRDGLFLMDLCQELKRARGKFPSSRYMFAALIEEVGEVGKALCEGDGWNVRAELVQVAVCALRMATEGDPAYPPRGILEGREHTQRKAAAPPSKGISDA